MIPARSRTAGPRRPRGRARAAGSSRRRPGRDRRAATAVPVRGGPPAPSRPWSRRPHRSPGGVHGAARAVAVGRRDRRRTGSAAGSSPSTSRGPGPAANVGSRYASPNRHARYGPTSTPGSPVVIQPAMRPADPAAAPEPVERQPGRHPEAADAGERPEQRVRVGGHRVRMADQADRLGVGEERESPDRPRHQRCESLVVGRQGARRVLPRHPVLPAGHRIELVAAEDHAAVLALAVDEVVRVAEARHVAGQLRARARP